MPYEMTTSVRFCLSCDPLKWDFIAYKMSISVISQHHVETDVVNDIMYMYTRQNVIDVWSYDFYDTTLSTE